MFTIDALPPPEFIRPINAVEVSAKPVADRDPFVRFNRKMFAANAIIDDHIVRPATKAYVRITPVFVRSGVHNFLQNWGEPSIAINDILQLKMSQCATTVVRFSVNSTVGLFGVADVASKFGVAHHDDDFGLTLARYGVSEGPYIFLPVVGPTTVRGAVGAVADFFDNPVAQVRHVHGETLEFTQSVFDALNSPGRQVLDAVDGRIANDSVLSDITITATDPYASLRSIYLQNLRIRVSGRQDLLDGSPDIPLPDAPGVPDSSV